VLALRRKSKCTYTESPIASAEGGKKNTWLTIDVRDVVGRHAHEEDGRPVGVDVPVHPFRPRLEHLLVRHGAVHLHVLGGALVEGALAAYRNKNNNVSQRSSFARASATHCRTSH